MRVLVLSTTARLRSDWVESVRQGLPADEVDLRLILVSPPAEPLPVTRCLVVGRSLRRGRWVRAARVHGGPEPLPAGRVHRWMRKVDLRLLRLLPERIGQDRRRMLASGVIWSRTARAEFAGADLVVADDFNATWAAYLLAGRVAGPEVVFQAEGAVLKLAELGMRTHDSDRAERSR